MKPEMIAPNVLAWGVDEMEANTIRQAARGASMPFVKSHLALMPDAHLGFGSTVGSVIPTQGAIMPAAVGVDIGCGMIAADTGLTSHGLPDDLSFLHRQIAERIPAGVGKGRVKDVPGKGRAAMPRSLEQAPAFLYMPADLRAVAANQLGSLGSGNHFVEVSLDERDHVWVVLHSGSRGVGNKLATRHIDIAKGLMKTWFIEGSLPVNETGKPDSDLAYLVQGTPEFTAYIGDMHWAQDYALANREVMMDEALAAIGVVTGAPVEPIERIQCHHNFTAEERHFGRSMWITRKGAVSARLGQRGIIPGSMGTSTFIVHGLGNRRSYESCSHGAGRRMGRKEARRQLSVDSLKEKMAGTTWNESMAEALLDEHPDSYKDVDAVMAAQSDLVAVDHTLHQILNFKGA